MIDRDSTLSIMRQCELLGEQLYRPCPYVFGRNHGCRDIASEHRPEEAGPGLVDNPQVEEVRGGRAFLDKESGCVKWVNCSSVTAIMPMQRSRDHETTLTQEPLSEVQGAGCPGSATGRCHAGRTRMRAKVGELTMERDFLAGALGRGGLPSAKR